jgi:hypothetical protein
MARLELSEPFSSKWRKGYIRISKKDGRARVDLVNGKKDRTTISLARYLLGVQAGRFLDDDEEADHIDGDGTNDALSNLQVLSVEQHLKKTVSEMPPRKVSTLTCPHCGVIFTRFTNQTGHRKNSFCSRSCSGKFYGFTNMRG